MINLHLLHDKSESIFYSIINRLIFGIDIILAQISYTII